MQLCEVISVMCTLSSEVAAMHHVGEVEMGEQAGDIGATRVGLSVDHPERAHHEHRSGQAEGQPSAEA